MAQFNKPEYYAVPFHAASRTEVEKDKEDASNLKLTAFEEYKTLGKVSGEKENYFESSVETEKCLQEFVNMCGDEVHFFNDSSTQVKSRESKPTSRCVSFALVSYKPPSVPKEVKYCYLSVSGEAENFFFGLLFVTLIKILLKILIYLMQDSIPSLKVRMDYLQIRKKNRIILIKNVLKRAIC